MHGYFDDEDADEDEHPSVIDSDFKARRLTEMCATCIMRSPADGQIQLGSERVRAFITEVRDAGSYVVCHSTILRDDVQPAICRGFADRYGSNYLRIMERLGGFADVPPPPERKGSD